MKLKNSYVIPLMLEKYITSICNVDYRVRDSAGDAADDEFAKKLASPDLQCE